MAIPLDLKEIVTTQELAISNMLEIEVSIYFNNFTARLLTISIEVIFGDQNGKFNLKLN
jgi:hypothetical protein